MHKIISVNLFVKRFLYFCLTMLSLSTYAQTDRHLEYSGLFDTYYHRGPIKFIGNLGTITYNGEGNKRVNFKSPGFYGGVGVGYQFLPHSLFVSELNVMNFGYDYNLENGSEINFAIRNIELNVHGRLYFLYDRITTKRQQIQDGKKRLKLYLLMGLGLNQYKATVDINETTAIEQKEPHYAIVAPLGFGAEFRINNKFSVLGEISRRFWLSNNDPINRDIITGYHTATIKVQYNPWGRKEKKKIILSAPTTPTHFYSPNGVAPNNKRREEESGGHAPSDDDEYNDDSEETPSEEESTEEDPFSDF